MSEDDKNPEVIAIPDPVEEEEQTSNDGKLILPDRSANCKRYT